jgi:rare lipoprotein A (peptidoglycan hydrolase)
MRTLTIVKTKLPFLAPLAALVLVAALGLVFDSASASATETTATSVGATSAPSESESEAAEGQSEGQGGPGSESEAATREEEEEEEEAAALNGVSFATWYGPGLFGRHTACGQLLTKQTVGVANRILPCGTLVEVSYKGRHETIPVIDRGPYGTGANWDLTQGAARLLHITESVDIRAKIVGRVKNSPELGLSAEAAKKKQTESGSTGGASA